MKKSYSISLTLCLLISGQLVLAADLSTDKQKLSYAMGVFFGQSVSRQDMDIETDAFMQAVKDVLDKNQLKLSSDEMQRILTEYQQKETRQRQAASKNNKIDGEKFLAENKNKKGVTELPSGLQYKVIKQGAGPKPDANSTVSVHYRGTLIDGKEFDSSYSRGQPADLSLTRVIKGWQVAIPLMQTGSKWQIYVPSELAYGARGAGGIIGPYSTLIFDIELLEIK